MILFNGYLIAVKENKNHNYSIQVSKDDEFHEIIYESYDIIKEDLEKEINLAKIQIEHLIALRQEL